MGQIQTCYHCGDILDAEKGVKVDGHWLCPRCMNKVGVNAKAIKASSRARSNAVEPFDWRKRQGTQASRQASFIEDHAPTS